MQVVISRGGKLAFVLMLSAVLVVAFAAHAFAESTLAKVLKRGELLAGICSAEPPSCYIDAQGHQVGYTADVARYVAARLGVKLRFIPVTSASRIPLLKTGRIDAEFGITTPQKVRNEVVDFTYTYIFDTGRIMVRKGESTDPKDYYNTSKVIGDTVGDGFIALWKANSPDAKFRLFQTRADVATALEKGEVDAQLISGIVGRRYAGQSGGRLVLGGIFESTPNIDAIMVRQDDSRWRNWLNWALQRMWVEGTFQKLYKKWYGIEPDFKLGDDGIIQPRVMQIGKTDDPWHPLPSGFLKSLLGPHSYTLAN